MAHDNDANEAGRAATSEKDPALLRHDSEATGKTFADVLDTLLVISKLKNHACNDSSQHAFRRLRHCLVRTCGTAIYGDQRRTAF
jgi:hypothetical protein